MSQGLEESEQAEHFGFWIRRIFADNLPSESAFFLGGGFLEDWLWRLASLCCGDAGYIYAVPKRDVELALRLPVLVSIPVIEYGREGREKYSSSLKRGDQPRVREQELKSQHGSNGSIDKRKFHESDSRSLKKAEQERWQAGGPEGRGAAERLVPSGRQDRLLRPRQFLLQPCCGFEYSERFQDTPARRAAGQMCSKPSGIPIQFPGVLQLRKEFCQEPSSSPHLRSALHRIRESKTLSILLVSSATPAEAKHSYPRIWRRFWPPTRLPDLVDRCRYARPKAASTLGALPDLALRKYPAGWNW